MSLAEIDDTISAGSSRNAGSSRAFVPGHITGFFAARRETELLQEGSIGCGLTIGIGARTAAERADRMRVILNGEASDAPVTRYVADALAKSPVLVKTDLQMPLGSGFGASGAGAIGCAYALNDLFQLGLTANGAATIAHAAEVTNGTGLGDVIAQNTGGLVVRIRHGAPGIGQVDRIPVPPTPIYCVVQGPISTKEILADPAVMRHVNAAGERATKELLQMPTLERFMSLSRRFALESGLASDWARDAIEAVQAAGGMASMVMLGDSVFATGPGTAEALSEFGAVIATEIVQWGARLD